MSKNISGAASGAKKATIHAAQLGLEALEVEGRRLAVWPDGQLRVQDEELGRLLGYARPRTVRDLIERLVAAGNLNDVEVCRTARQTSGGRPGTEYWLTEAQALKVAARSETGVADALLDEMIRVFMLARRGLAVGHAEEAPSTPPPAPPSPPPALPTPASSADRNREAALELLGPDLDARVHRALLRLPASRRGSVRYWMARAQELHDLLVGARSVGWAPPPRSPSEALAYAERTIDCLDREVNLLAEAASQDAEGISSAELLFRWSRIALADAALVHGPAEQERRKEAIARLAGLANRFTLQATKLRKTRAAALPARRRAVGGS